MGKIKNLINNKYGRLTVIEQDYTFCGRGTKWICQCDCGKVVSINSGNLKSGNTKSCGCLHDELSSARYSKINYKHGLSKHRLNHVWAGMKQRCFNPKATEYSAYGGRGITVCDEWKNNYESFFNYVSKLQHFDEKGYSLDRINNNGNYEPGNVRWATLTQQYENRGY